MIYAAPGAAGAKIAYKARYDNFIGGKFVAPVKGQYFDVITPISGKVYTQAARSTAEDIDLALDAAHAAADAWGKTDAASRANVLLKIADRHRVPLIRTQLKSKDFSAEATVLLEEKFAPRTNLHATLVDIKGIGVLLRGASGVGKSECALALIERGHSLVADDYVIVTLIADRELQGTSKELNRGYMECRGIGIINVASIFGVRSVRREKRVDLVVTFVLWQPGMDEERSGLEVETFEILGRKVAHMTIPVRPGRDMARLVEVAAMVHALRGMGHDSAKEFSDRLIQFMSKDGERKA